ncbi:MAG TPA: DsbC family protein [Gammaproteobacteria bacterium]|nr:DsbC family protein [Gammaproteobacteria bacterium]
MCKRWLLNWVAYAALFLSSSVWASEQEVSQVREQLLNIQPDLTIDSITLSPMPELYQVQLRGGRILYVSASAEFIVQGQLLQVQDGVPFNLTEQAERKARAKQVQALNQQDMVVFPAQKRQTYITVFTDTDCGYCQKFHTDVAELNRLGVEVRYLAFPRNGLSGDAYDSLVSVWCADDRLAAMTQAKSRKSVASETCKHPVDTHFAMGRTLGVQGTPTIVLADGQIIPGYQPAQQLAAQALKAQP